MANGHGRGRILMTSATGIGEAESGRCLLRRGAAEASGEASGAVSAAGLPPVGGSMGAAWGSTLAKATLVVSWD